MTDSTRAAETVAETIAETITKAIDALLVTPNSAAAPPAEDVIAALLSAEKHSKRTKAQYAYAQMLGSWRLRLVSGTQKVRSATGRSPAKPLTRPGKGRYLPAWVNIQITYSIEAGGAEAEAIGTDTAIGSVENSVSVGPLKLCLTGPTRFWPATNSLAFDFTHVRVRLGALKLYEGDVRGGAARNQTFMTQTLKDQAFFTFFGVADRYLAARGKGGGLALWTRQES